MNKHYAIINDIFSRAAFSVGLKDGEACRAVLERDYSTDHGYTWAFEEKYGITVDDYPEVLRRCKEAFRVVTGVSYLDFRAGAAPSVRLASPTTGHEPPAALLGYLAKHNMLDKMQAHHIPELHKTLLWATQNLSEREFYILAATNLFSAEHKKSFAPLAEELGIKLETVRKTHGVVKQKVKDHESYLGLKDNPYFRTRFSMQDAEEERRYLDSIPELDLTDEKTLMLYRMALTACKGRDFTVLCYEIFQSPDVPRDRAEIASRLGISSGKKYYSDVVVVRALDELKKLIAFSKTPEALSDHLEILRSDLVFVGANAAKTLSIWEGVDESKINTSIPGVKDILSAVYDVSERGGKNKSWCAMFIMTSLYDARHKLTKREICNRYGYSPTVVVRSGLVKAEVAELLRERGLEELAEHPLLQRRELTDGRDRPARKVIGTKKFEALIDSLSESNKALAERAALILNPLRYYCYVRQELSDPKASYAQIEEELRLPPGKISGSLLKQARAAMQYFAQSSLKEFTPPEPPDPASEPSSP